MEGKAKKSLLASPRSHSVGDIEEGRRLKDSSAYYTNPSHLLYNKQAPTAIPSVGDAHWGF